MTPKTTIYTKKQPRPLPPGWRWARLGDHNVATIIMGQSPPGNTYVKEPIGLPFYQGKADFGELYPSPTVWCTKPIRIAEPGDVLLSVRAPVGPTNIAGEKCCIGRGLAAIRPTEILLTYYLLAVLRYLERKLADTGSGSTFEAIGREQIEEIVFPLPPLPEQRDIATRLEAQIAEVQRMHQATEHQMEAINALPGALLREFFGGFEPPDGG
jgi:type I restriction enzyme S subunit